MNSKEHLPCPTKIIGIHQPNFIPNLAYFKKIMMSDVFIYYDDAEYTKGGYINRNKIIINGENKFITVPIVSKSKQPINEVELHKWDITKKKLLKTFKQAHGRAPFYEEVITGIKNAWDIEFSNLVMINIFTNRFILDYLDIDTKLMLSSCICYNRKADATFKLISLINEVGGNAYIPGGEHNNYINDHKWNRSKIKNIPLNYTGIIDISILNYLFMFGKETKGILLNKRNE